MVCNRWESFSNFIEDMGLRPSEKHSIDRVNNEKGYSPDNCIWNTSEKQNMNQRKRKGSGRYRGVTLVESGRFKATIKLKISIHIGTYDKEVDAAKAYDAKAIELDVGHILNFKQEGGL